MVQFFCFIEVLLHLTPYTLRCNTFEIVNNFFLLFVFLLYMFTPFNSLNTLISKLLHLKNEHIYTLMKNVHIQMKKKMFFIIYFYASLTLYLLQLAKYKML